jgi:ribonucleoside-diphosphate reductase alpha chain
MTKLHIQPHFMSKHEELDDIDWTQRDVILRRPTGEIVFEQRGVKFPSFWSDTAVTIACDKYLRVKADGSRETGLPELVERVVKPIMHQGVKCGYFDDASSHAFGLDLMYLLINQYFSFNSPVYFNVGIEDRPQVSACFIQSVEDDMHSILTLVEKEGMIFKNGSGSGTNFSQLRGANERLAGGGLASGPVSFMKGYDAFSGVIRSGGKTRRAAKMAILDVSHPDIWDFIECKRIEEQKARALADAGWDRSFDAKQGAYSSVAYQNENHSVRVNSAFMRAVQEDLEWKLYSIKGSQLVHTYKARELWRLIADCAHDCGDPGLQFSDTINTWNTISNSGEIKASNPCSEYLSINDSACNLASLNLMRFVHAEGNGWYFDTRAFAAAVRIGIIAQEILISMASYPTPEIAKNVETYRQLGLGYSNLGALFMYCGYPYDSSEARALAGCVSSLMTATGYATSAEIAATTGPFEGYERNYKPMQTVIEMHRAAAEKLCDNLERQNHRVPAIERVKTAANKIWSLARKRGLEHGYRNSQVTLIAPCGTIGPFMDCDTNGAEPEVMLVKYKQLVGGGTLKMVNSGVPTALRNLGYDDKQVALISEYVADHGTVEGCRELKLEHLPIFDCALDVQKSGRYIAPMGHVKMLAAIQPHISGGISKTLNMPADSTVDDIQSIFMSAWSAGVKCLTIYRDQSKLSQPLSSGKATKKEVVAKIEKRRMPDERRSVCHAFKIAGHKVYLHVGFYPDGKVGEMFVTAAKAGSAMSGFLSCLATAVSLGLQWGVPLAQYVRKFSHVSFDPQGFTGNREIGLAKSIPDYIFRYMARYVEDPDAAVSIDHENGKPLELPPPAPSEDAGPASEAPPCPHCGAIMARNGSCYACRTCGETSGCS